MRIEQKDWILYADDDPDDRLLLEETFRNAGNGKNLLTFSDGKEALEYMDRHTPPYPSLMILDLNMPGLNGRDVVERVQSHPHYKDIPVVIFTTSANPVERNRFARMGIEMITKPMDLTEFEQTVARLVGYCR